MKKALLLYLLVCLNMFLLNGQVKKSDFEANKLYVKSWIKLPVIENQNLTFEKEDSIINRLFGDRFGIITVEKTFRIKDSILDRFYTFTFKNEQVTDLFLKESNSFSFIEFAERIPIHFSEYTPNDLQSTQWNLNKISATNAWDRIKGDSTITIAIVDDAVLTSHEDLKGVIWRNINEIPGNGIDDDKNGYVDDVIGWDAADNDNNPNPPSSGVSSTNFSHGTHCAGIAGAATDNSKGIAGIAFNVKIIPVKAKRSNTTGGILHAILKGLEYAIAANARVVSMSFGSYYTSQTEQTLIDYGHNKGIIFVAAAGNDATQLPLYPANYNHVIGVGATAQNDLITSFSNYGGSVDVMAPGLSILSTLATNDSAYGNMSGTSMACPLVSGLAALMLSLNPSYGPAEIESCLKSTADDIYPLHSNPVYTGNLGAGRINAEEAVKCVMPILAKFENNINKVCPGGQVNFFDKSITGATAWYWEFSGGNPSTSTQKNPTVTYANAGIYKVKLRVSNQNGVDSVEVNNLIQVAIPSAALSGNYNIPQGYGANIVVNFQGMPPYRVKVNNGSNSTWHNNILETPYYISVSPANSTTYFLDSMFDRTCSGTVKDSAKVIVLPFSTDSCLGSTKTFLKIYPTNNNDNVHGVVACRDNGFLVYGITNGGFGSNDLFVFKTNDTGAIIWSRNIGSTSGESGFSVKGIETRDSGFALVFDSRAFSSAEEAIFVKLNKNGQIQFQRRIGGTGLEYGRALIQTKDLGYAIGGTTASSPKSGLQDGYLVKLDASGNLQWQSNFGFAGNTTNHITDILELPFGNLIAIGAGDHKVASYVTFLVKLRPNGTVLSEKRLSLSNIETFINADITADGKIVLGGLQDVNSNDFSGQLRFLITKLDTSLNTIWTKNYLRSGSTFWGMSAIAAKDSGILIIGNERMSSRDYLTVLKVDAGGNPLWTKRFGRNNSNELTSRWAHAIKRTNDNGFIIAGNSDGFGYSRTNPVLLKINNCGGGVNCDIVNVSLTQGNVSLNNSSVTSIKTNGMQVQTAALSSNAMSFTDTVNLCYKATFDLTCAIKADFNATSSCVGQATSFVSTSSDAGNKNIVFWRWIMNDTDTINGSPAIKYAFNNAGNQKVKLIVGNNALPACYDTITKFIAISNTFGFDLSKPDTLCENDSAFVFVSNIYCQSGNVKYNWSPGRFFVDSTAQNGRFALTTSGWVKVTLTDSLQNKATDSFFVTVNTNCCKTTASFLTDKPSYCQGDTVRFINQSLTKGTTTYFWDFGNQSNPIDYVGENPPPVFFSGNGSYAVQLNVNASCGASSVTNNVYVLPVPSIDILKDTFLCQPGNVLLSQSDNLAGFSYEWLPNAGLSSVNIINPIANITNTITYKVKARNDWTACSSEDSVKISLGDLSFFSLGNDSLFCDQVNREYNYAGIADNVLWENGSNNKYRKIENPGTYNITWEIQSCKAYDTVTFNLVQMPMDSIIGEKSFCVNDSAFYSLTKSYDSVLWFDGSTNIGIFQRLGGQIGVTVFDKICSKTYSKQIEVIDLQPKIIGQTSLCEGDSTLLLANLNDVLYLWDNGSTDSFIYANRVGKVSLTVEKEGCSFSDSVLISSTPLPMPFDLGKDTVVCLDDKPFIVSPLYDTASGSTFVWDDNSRNFTRSIFDNGRYYAVAANNCGIVADSITVEFESCDCEVYVPNAFTPNRNGLNDLFLTNSCEVKSFQMLIFDRWGAKIFESDDINKGWDGKIKGDEPYNSVYVVVVNIIYTNGKRLNHKGFVNLIR